MRILAIALALHVGLVYGAVVDAECASNVDHLDGDLPGMPIELPTRLLPGNVTCAAACAGDPVCVGWVVQERSCSGQATTNCWLKQQWFTGQPRPCRCSLQAANKTLPPLSPPSSSSDTAQLSNSFVRASFSTAARGMQSIAPAGAPTTEQDTLDVSDGFLIALGNETLDAWSGALQPSPAGLQSSATAVSLVLQQPGGCLAVNVTYELQPSWRFITKQLFLSSRCGAPPANSSADVVASVAVLYGAAVSPQRLGLASWAVPNQYTGDLAALLRFGPQPNAPHRAHKPSAPGQPTPSKATTAPPSGVVEAGLPGRLRNEVAVSGTGLVVAVQNAVAQMHVVTNVSTPATAPVARQPAAQVTALYRPMLRLSETQSVVGFDASTGASPPGYAPLFASDRAVVAAVPLSRWEYEYPTARNPAASNTPERSHTVDETTAGSIRGSSAAVNTAERDLLRHAASAFYIAPHRNPPAADEEQGSGDSPSSSFQQWREQAMKSGQATPYPWRIGDKPRPDWFFDEGALAFQVPWTLNDFEIDAAEEWAGTESTSTTFASSLPGVVSRRLRRDGRRLRDASSSTAPLERPRDPPPPAPQQGEYHRVLQTNARWGVDRTLYEPHNSRLSSFDNATDSWGWEEALWFAYGEKLREGEWSPQLQPPQSVDWSVSRAVSFAASLNMTLAPYIYPNLQLGGNPSFWHNADGQMQGSIGDEDFQDWFIGAVLNFTALVGSQGAGFDYTFANDASRSFYQQWAGWRRVLSTLRSTVPGFSIDNRQENHEWGAWMWTAGSYAEPLMSDENAGTWGGTSLLGDPRTDRMSANRVRFINVQYANNHFCPVEALPGFAFHQTDRAYDHGSGREHDEVVRDFDWQGYRYSLLSSLAHAPLNTVVCQNGGRDAALYEALPKLDQSFVTQWLSWADSNLDLARTATPLSGVVPAGSTGAVAANPGTGLPQRGIVDGSVMWLSDTGPGLIMLFNPAPNTSVTPAQLQLDDSINITCAPSESFEIVEVFPSVGTPVGTFACGTSLAGRPIAGRAVVVWSVKRADSAAEPGANTPQAAWDATVIPYDMDFTGGTKTGSVVVPAAVWNAVEAVNASLPVPWSAFDLVSPWLGVDRLWLFVDLAHDAQGAVSGVSLTVNGAPCDIAPSFNAPHGRRSDTFNGFLADLRLCGVSSAAPAVNVSLTVQSCAAGSFHGAFLDAAGTTNYGLV